MVISVSDLENLFVEAMVVGTGFAIPIYIGFGAMARNVLNHPTARKIGQAAAAFSKGDQAGWATIVREIIGLFKPSEKPKS